MKFERVKGNVPVFSEDYDGRDRTIFGKEEQSDNINDQFTEEYKTGWGIVGKNEFPTLQDFNALGYTLNNLISYLYQSGVAEYSADADYYKGSVVQNGDSLYICLVDSPTSEPNRTSIEWLQLRDIKDNRFDGMLQIHADNTSGTSLFLLDNKGAVRGQMGFSNMGLQFAQHIDGGGYTYTLPKESGELLIDKRITHSTGTSNDLIMSQVGVYSAILRAMPVGTVQMYVGNVPPNDDWLLMRGTFDVKQYPLLAKFFPDGVLPDVRGTFPRFWDDGRGLDPNRALLSYQEDAMQKIEGFVSDAFGYMNVRSEGALYFGKYSSTHNFLKSGSTSNRYGYAGTLRFDASRVVRTAPETRPRNTAFNAIIKAR